MEFVRRQLSVPRLFGTATVLVLLWGMHAGLDRFITPQRGLGYTLGIVGGSLMLVLVVYPMRKRLEWMRFAGSITFWFQAHMVLGTIGPVCILFHSNFSTGSTNSDVALACMLVVAISGVIGRYLYTRLHERLDGREANLGELQGIADQLRQQTTTVTILPGLLDAIEAEEQRLLKDWKFPFGRVLHFLLAPPRAALARWRMRRLIHQAVRAAAKESRPIAANAHRLEVTARNYAVRRLDAGRKVAEFRAYTRLFSYWHVLHVPMYIMLVIAGIVHVVAVSVY